MLIEKYNTQKRKDNNIYNNDVKYKRENRKAMKRK